MPHVVEQVEAVVGRLTGGHDDERIRALALYVAVEEQRGVTLRVAHDLACPKCGGFTDAINYGGDSGIIIDRCNNCGGIWLDRGELEKIQKLVEGWDDKLPEDLKAYGSKLRKVEAEVDQRDDVGFARFGFLNAMINGILDWRMR